MNAGEEAVPGYCVIFTPAELAVGANLMALGLAMMSNNRAQGEQIGRLLSAPHIAQIAVAATQKMAAALHDDAPDGTSDDADTEET